MKLGQTLAFFRMADGVELEFHVEQHALAILAHLDQIFHQPLNLLFYRGQFCKYPSQLGVIPLDILLENREENFFLVFKMIVKGSARFTDARCDILEPSVLKTIAREDFSSRLQKLLARDLRPLLPVKS